VSLVRSIAVTRRRLRWTRSRGQRIVIGVNVVLISALAIGAGGVWYAAQKLGDVQRIDVAGQLTAAPEGSPLTAADIRIIDPATMVAQAGTTTTEPSEPPGPAENYLIVGSDNAEEVDPNNPILIGRDVTSNLADTIMLLRLEPETGAATLLSIPRDLEVEISGTDRKLKINAAFNFEEPYVDRVARLINTVEEGLDVGIQHYLEVDIAAFQRLVDQVGGVMVCFDGPSRDSETGLDIATGGWHELDGTAALAFVRSRAMDTQNRDGVWKNVSGRADLDRIERQQEFAREAIDQVAGDISTSPGLLFGVLDIAADELVVSNSFDVVGDGRNLAAWFGGIEDDDLLTMSLKVEDLPKTPEHGDEFRLGMLAEAEGQLDIFRGIGPFDVVPKRVDVTVLGTERAVVSEGLAELDFDASSATSVSGDEVVIRYGFGGHQAANLVAAFLDARIEFVADADLFGNEIVLELGAEAPAVLATPRVLTVAAQELVVPTTTSTTVVGPTTTEAPVLSEWPFDCSLPKPE